MMTSPKNSSSLNKNGKQRSYNNADIEEYTTLTVTRKPRKVNNSNQSGKGPKKFVNGGGGGTNMTQSASLKHLGRKGRVNSDLIPVAEM